MRKLIIIGLLFTLAHASKGLTAEITVDPNAPDRYVVVPGDTLWGIARTVADGRDPRAVVHQIGTLNGVEADALVPVQVLAVPSR